MTRPGVISGTPGYRSPEQYRGGDIDSRSDQWSFCAALYEALYGYLNPFSESLFKTLKYHPGYPARFDDCAAAQAYCAAFARHPQRFVHGLPTAPALPDAVWINPPSPEPQPLGQDQKEPLQ